MSELQEKCNNITIMRAMKEECYNNLMLYNNFIMYNSAIIITLGKKEFFLTKEAREDVSE